MRHRLLLRDLENQGINLGWDSGEDNYRRDSRGKIWRIDTQVKPIP